MVFQISPLSAKQFEHLFQISADDLAQFQAKRMRVTEKPGFPCRVSLQDGEIGEEVVLVNFEHQTANSPFRASHAVYVRAGAEQAESSRNEVPEMLRSRILSLRGFDDDGMLTAAELADGKAVEAAIEQIFLEPQVSYVHIHFAKPGCYAARVDRA